VIGSRYCQRDSARAQCTAAPAAVCTLAGQQDVDEAAGMLLGMMVFEPQRRGPYGRQPLPDRTAISERASACTRLFLQGCRFD
jgi:hypothetical protein